MKWSISILIIVGYALPATAQVKLFDDVYLGTQLDSFKKQHPNAEFDKFFDDHQKRMNAASGYTLDHVSYRYSTKEIEVDVRFSRRSKKEPYIANGVKAQYINLFDNPTPQRLQDNRDMLVRGKEAVASFPLRKQPDGNLLGYDVINAEGKTIVYQFEHNPRVPESTIVVCYVPRRTDISRNSSYEEVERFFDFC